MKIIKNNFIWKITLNIYPIISIIIRSKLKIGTINLNIYIYCIRIL